jgi:hypothetical protein
MRAHVCAAAVIALAALAIGCHGDSSNGTTPDPILKVTGVSPGTGSLDGGTELTVLGKNFQTGATVTFSGVAVTATEVRSTYARVIAPPHALGAVDVMVTNPDGTHATLKGAFTYTGPPPPPPFVIASVFPEQVAVGGGAWVQINGSGFQTDATVTVDGLPTEAWISTDGFTRIYLPHVPPHVAGPVDLVVTNPDGRTARLAQRLTYVPASSFDFNGTWDGFPFDTEPSTFSFTVVGNTVTTVTCGKAAPITLSPAVTVVNGTFSFSGEDGTSMSGQLVAAGQSQGTLNLPVCGAVDWFGWRR